MQAVLEEIEAGIVSFIPEDKSETKYVHLDRLAMKQEDLKVGALYELKLSKTSEVIDCSLLDSEQEERKKRIKSKREQLLKKNK